MPDEPLPSLDDLRRQRDLVAAHLAWLDRQITQREASAPRVTPPPNVPGGHVPPGGLDVPAADADAILEQYRVEPTNVSRDVRRGCLLYFALGFLLLAGLVWLLYVALR